jgi:hypothetical protein
MAIVHPAFCEVGRHLDGTFQGVWFHRGYLFCPLCATTKHCKNRVYSAGTLDVFSGQSSMPDNKKIETGTT